MTPAHRQTSSPTRREIRVPPSAFRAADRARRVDRRARAAARRAAGGPGRLQPRLRGHAARSRACEFAFGRGAGEGTGDRAVEPRRRRRGDRRPRDIAIAAVADDRVRRFQRRDEEADRTAAGDAAAVADAGAPRARASAGDRAAARPGHTRRARAGRPQAAADRGRGRDREAHQRRERATEEALHQPGDARRGLRALLRCAAPQDRRARHAQLSREPGPQALRRADDERDRRCRRPSRRDRGRSWLGLEDSRPSRRRHRHGRRAVRPLQTRRCARRPISSSSPRAFASRATPIWRRR